MNTLSKSVTLQIYDGSEYYIALRKRWSELMNSDHRNELSAAHHLLYHALCGKDWRKAFTPVTNQRKLQNGAYWNWGLFRAMRHFHSKRHEQWLLAPFDSVVDQETLNRIRQYVSLVQPYQYKAEEFTPGTFPFDAYNDLEESIEKDLTEE